MRHPLRLPLLAAVLLSAAAHAAIAILAGGGDPLAASIDASFVTSRQNAPNPRERSMLQARLAVAQPPPALESTHPVVAGDAPAPTSMKAARERSLSASVPVEPIDKSLQDVEPRVDHEAQLSPTPLTYPVISLPSDDDPHRIGFVRLLLVVSSEGRVAQTVVADTTLSQDYVDRIAHSFDDVRFKPASAHGFPRPGWYEVVVNLEFDPEARSAL